MNQSVVNLLQEKYPNKTLAVLDIRTATLRGSRVGKDIAFSEMVTHVRKPRSEHSVDLTEFDEELALFVCVEGSTLYYMPTRYNRYCNYKTNVSATGSVMDDVAQMVQVGLEQNKESHGDMKLGETRMFCLHNDQTLHSYNQAEATSAGAEVASAYVHVTVQRERQRFQIAAEVASVPAQETSAGVKMGTDNGGSFLCQSPGYQVMLSLQFPAEDLQQSIADKAGNVAYYAN